MEEILGYPPMSCALWTSSSLALRLAITLHDIGISSYEHCAWKILGCLQISFALGIFSYLLCRIAVPLHALGISSNELRALDLLLFSEMPLPYMPLGYPAMSFALEISSILAFLIALPYMHLVP